VGCGNQFVRREEISHLFSWGEGASASVGALSLFRRLDRLILRFKLLHGFDQSSHVVEFQS
jgi:hypothetical protein